MTPNKKSRAEFELTNDAVIYAVALGPLCQVFDPPIPVRKKDDMALVRDGESWKCMETEE